jgi:hypothetical protein
MTLASDFGEVARLPDLIESLLSERLARQVEELIHLSSERLLANEVHVERQVDLHRQPRAEVVDTPVGPVREDDPLDASFTAYICACRRCFAPSLVATRFTSTNATRSRSIRMP